MVDKGWLVGKPCLWKGKYKAIAYSYNYSGGETNYSIFCLAESKSKMIVIYNSIPEEELVPVHPDSLQARVISSNVLTGLNIDRENLEEKIRDLENKILEEKNLPF